jgi:hypothetical protein
VFTEQHIVQIHYISLSFRLFVPSSLTVCHRSLLSMVSANFHLAFLPVARFSFSGDYSPTTTTAPSLMFLVSCSSLISCQPVQVYYHHPRPRVPLDHVYHITDPGMGLPTRIKIWAISPSCGLGDRATLCRPRGNLRNWLVYCTEFSSGHWRASDVGGHNGGCHVNSPKNLLHDRLWVIPCLEVLQTVDRRAVGVLARTVG